MQYHESSQRYLDAIAHRNAMAKRLRERAEKNFNDAQLKKIRAKQNFDVVMIAVTCALIITIFMVVL